VVSGQWSVVSGQWSVVSGQWSVVSGQWSVVSGQMNCSRRFRDVKHFSEEQSARTTGKKLITDHCSLSTVLERPISLSRPYVVGFSRMGRSVSAAPKGIGTHESQELELLHSPRFAA
jgi:hypothetical protein